VAVDLLEIEPIAGVHIIKGDVSERGISGIIAETLGGAPDIVLSDMAAPTTGHRQTDHLRTMNLCEIALDFAIENLNHGGSVVAKVFQGGTQSSLLAGIKPLFETIKHVKPAASRKESPETYLVAKGFKKKCP
jgi:23S rRNA (uridine2552-2'-O)-methyltransferase